MKVISCAGFGCTGSSIITDFFREVSNVYSVGGNGLEFFLLHEPDGIKDLETALVEGHRFKADLAIKRFMRLVNNLYYHNPSGPNYKDFFNGKFLEITNEYLASLDIISWERGWWHRIFEDNDNKLHRLIKKFRFQSYAKKAYHLYEPDSWKPTYTGYKKEYYAHINRGQFEQKTKAYLSRLFSEIDTDAEYLLFDQLFPPSNAGEYTNYFDSVKVFIVDRDPRDLYFANKVFWGCGFIPMDSAAIFTEWYRNTREATKITPNVCLVSFEDFIFKTDETLRFAMDFVGIPYSYHNKKNTFLCPRKSVGNTQFSKRWAFADVQLQSKMDGDIEVIRKELKEFLYDFDEGIVVEQKERLSLTYEKGWDKINRENVFFSFILTFPSILVRILRKIRENLNI